MSINRRDLLVSTAATVLFGVMAGGVHAAEGDVFDINQLMQVALPDHVMGAETAPVTVIEYASPTCPHCATFHNTVYPTFKERYIDTGKVKFIVRPFSRNVLDTAVFMLAEAAGPEMYHTVLESYFATQAAWMSSDRPRDALLAQAMQLGFTEESFDAALTNQELATGIDTMRNQALEEFRLEGTPTFYINGKQLTGDKTIDQLAAEIDPLLPPESAAPAAPATPANSTPATPANTTAPAAVPANSPAPAAPANTMSPAAPANAMAPANSQ
ncbi:Protein-disulfide isomerase [Devosia enhydra]|uniref:Protein-disulfide isomerase n=1 Tax=Devosia enhydra TaxID=665118 RepID=A0A1K2I2W0_9HYPH|nr:DsbA family protein [Devosia enhydra]SFZ86100.1 Protein-disulfide isomerase [Devosia enhydra]